MKATENTITDVTQLILSAADKSDLLRVDLKIYIDSSTRRSTEEYTVDTYPVSNCELVAWNHSRLKPGYVCLDGWVKKKVYNGKLQFTISKGPNGESTWFDSCSSATVAGLTFDISNLI